jgi:hypothetical protein
MNIVLCVICLLLVGVYFVELAMPADMLLRIMLAHATIAALFAMTAWALTPSVNRWLTLIMLAINGAALLLFALTQLYAIYMCERPIGALSGVTMISMLFAANVLALLQANRRTETKGPDVSLRGLIPVRAWERPSDIGLPFQPLSRRADRIRVRAHRR